MRLACPCRRREIEGAYLSYQPGIVPKVGRQEEKRARSEAEKQQTRRGVAERPRANQAQRAGERERERERKKARKRERERENERAQKEHGGGGLLLDSPGPSTTTGECRATPFFRAAGGRTRPRGHHGTMS